jgi:hypothetical protein
MGLKIIGTNKPIILDLFDRNKRGLGVGTKFWVQPIERSGSMLS